MKFWKILSSLIEETLPDWQDKFLSYKDLKKQLKLVYPKEGENDRTPKKPKFEESQCGSHHELTKEVIDFQKLLEDEIEKFNAFFVEKEEEYVIKWKELQNRVAEAKNSEDELIVVGREIVDFHGEMVLLENYSQLNYTGLVKIIKKYDKRSGALTRLPFIQKVLQQPFFTTDLLNKLVKECEAVLSNIFPKNSTSDRSCSLDPSDLSAVSISVNKEEGCESLRVTENEKASMVQKELTEIDNKESMYMKLTLSALRTLEEIRSGSSTVSAFSLPPLHSNALEELSKRIPVVEHVGKECGM